MQNSNYVFVICGAAGAGKTTVANYLHDHFNMHRVITHTTRTPRHNEQNGVDYYFETPASMDERHFLERVTYDGAQYGSSYEGLQQGWQAGKNDVIVLDTKGAVTYHQKLGQHAVIIFLTVSHMAALAKRMTLRGDKLSAISSRLHSEEYRRDLLLPAELQGVANVVVNDRWSKTKQQLNSLINNLVSE